MRVRTAYLDEVIGSMWLYFKNPYNFGEDSCMRNWKIISRYFEVYSV